MAEKSNISWTNATWNPVRGCERVSEGCRKCYAEVLAARHSYAGGWGEGLAKYVTRPDGTQEARWTGVIQTVEKMLDAPLRWREPRRIFVNSMSDLGHSKIPVDFLWKVLAIVALCPQHTFQVLTKRIDLLQPLLAISEEDALVKLCHALGSLLDGPWVWNEGKRFRPLIEKAISTTIGIGFDDDDNEMFVDTLPWPLPNLWLGVSVENQNTAEQRIPLLQATPAAVHFLSCEPLLGPIDLRSIAVRALGGTSYAKMYPAILPAPWIDWLIIGGESGSDYRPMNMGDARGLIQQGQKASAAVFVKQDNGARPGLQGRFTDEEWALKAYPT